MGCKSMKAIRRLLSKKYLNMVFFATISLLLVIVLGFSISMYVGSNRIIRNAIEQSNHDVLVQISNNVVNMNNLVRDLCLNAYYNADVMEIMNRTFNDGDDDRFGLQVRLDRVRKTFVTTNFYIHSISIYNGKTGIYYNTAVEKMASGDTNLEENLRSLKLRTPRAPFLRQISTSDNPDVQPEWVMTYAVYDSYDESMMQQGVIFVNVKPDWVMSDIDKLNQTNSRANQIYMLNNGRLFSSSHVDYTVTDEELLSVIRTGVLPELENHVGYGFLNSVIGKQKMILSFLNIPSIDWTLIRVQPNREVYASAWTLQGLLMGVTMLFFILSVLFAAFASKRIYQPVQKLMDRFVNEYPQGPGQRVDEIAIIEKVYSKSLDVLRIGAQADVSMKNTLKGFFLMKLLYESSSLRSEDIGKAIADQKLAVSIHGRYVLCLIRIVCEGSIEDRRLIAFAAANIAHDLISSGYVNDYETLKNGDAVLIVNAMDNEADESGKDADHGFGDEGKSTAVDAGSDFCERMRAELMKTQEYVRQFFQVSFCASVSPVFGDLTETTEALRHAYGELDYTYIFGKESIIIPQQTKANKVSAGWNYPFELEKRMIQDIREGKTESWKDTLLKMQSMFASMKYSNIQLSIIHLCTVVKNVLEEGKPKGIRLHEDKYERQYRDLMEQKTMEDLNAELCRFITDNSTSEVGNQEAQDENNIVVDTVRKIIELKYADKGLCTALIADTIRMNSTYVSRVFRDKTGQSISDAVNEMRIAKAAFLLKDRKINVVQAMERVGIESEAHFYRHFRKRYGMTPMEYVRESLGFFQGRDETGG